MSQFSQPLGYDGPWVGKRWEEGRGKGGDLQLWLHEVSWRGDLDPFPQSHLGSPRPQSSSPRLMSSQEGMEEAHRFLTPRAMQPQKEFQSAQERPGSDQENGS